MLRTQENTGSPLGVRPFSCLRFSYSRFQSLSFEQTISKPYLRPLGTTYRSKVRPDSRLNSPESLSTKNGRTHMWRTESRDSKTTLEFEVRGSGPHGLHSGCDYCMNTIVYMLFLTRRPLISGCFPSRGLEWTYPLPTHSGSPTRDLLHPSPSFCRLRCRRHLS